MSDRRKYGGKKEKNLIEKLAGQNRKFDFLPRERNLDGKEF